MAVMERRYRYPQVVGKAGKRKVTGQIIKFAIGWNILGYLIYRNMNKGMREKDPDGPEEYDKRTPDEKLRRMQNFYPNANPTKYKLYPSGLIKETSPDENSQTTHKLTLKGFEQVEMSKEELESSTNRSNKDKEEQLPVLKSVSKKNEGSPESSASKMYNSLASVIASLLNQTGLRKKDDS